MLGFFREFFADFSRLKLFFLIFSLSLMAILLSLWLGGFAATAVIVVPAILSILQLTKEVWTPEGGGKSKLGITSLGVALAVIVSNAAWRPYVNSFLGPLIEKYPDLAKLLPSDTPSIVTLLFLIIVIFIVNYFARDTTAMKEHPTPIDKEFPERDYKHHLRAFSGVLLDDLNKIDRETNWSAEIFTPLDAEVEIQSGSKRLKKVTDLLAAIRSDRNSRAFLVLGVPGSGKSVALRKLCRDLLKEVGLTGKVPLYVNLREWEPEDRWTESAPPTVEQLYDFVLDNLKSRGDYFTDEFLEKYFRKMFENGRLFIVLDSFDEIPAVLDVNESSWLVDKLSDVIHRFLAGAHESRGILASRVFRRPTDKFNAKTILEIRPFTELKIAQTLTKSLSHDNSLLETLFNSRQELIPIARNPFTAALITSYAKENSNTLPATQADLYSSYIQHRIEACGEKIRMKDLTCERLIECAVEIADVMFTTEAYGLEAPVAELAASLPHLPVAEAIDLLKYARLGRLGTGDENRFSFVHRRFNEYFVVQKLRQHPERIPTDAIPTDSRWRDALVLYCEVAEESNATRIARFCWSEVKKLTDQELDMKTPQYLRSVHCLRFLKEAFRSRLDCTESFRGELAQFISNQIEEDNLLSQKIAVEAVGLLKSDDIDEILTKALDVNNQWIDEVAFKSCYYLPQLSKRLITKLRIYIEGIGILDFLKRRKDLLFSLTLSDVFRSIRTYCYLRLMRIYLLLLLMLAVVCWNPIGFFVALISFTLIMRFIFLFEPELRGYPRSKAANLILANYMVASICMLVFSNPPRPFIKGFPAPFYRVHLLLCGFFLLFPWQIVSLSPRSLLRRIMATTRKEVFRFLLFVAGTLAFLLGVIVLPFYFLPRYWASVWSLLLVAGFLTLIISKLVGFMRPVISDYKYYRKIRTRMFFQREDIAKHFIALHFSKSKLRFVQLLQNSGVRPAGVWPDGRIPNHHGDAASTLLAQLEEKWLGLDR